MKVLHITNWYPNPIHPKEALWIQKHIDSLPFTVQSSVLHFEIFLDKNFNWYRLKTPIVKQFLLRLPIRSWRFIELVYLIWLAWQLLIRRHYKSYDIINFHVAYPMLTYWHLIKKWIRKPIIITEHWSAYHFNFGVKYDLPRIERIFKQKIPIITVSSALCQDIEVFSKTKQNCYILPNVVNEVFTKRMDSPKEDFFFMVSQWKEPKDPLPLMKAFIQFNEENDYRFKLYIGGYGSLYTMMMDWKVEFDLHNSIEFLGILDEQELFVKMSSCTAFLHPTNYETFSVVCAEAIASGAFVIAPRVGGIPEVVGNSGLLLDSWTMNDWKIAMESVVKMEKRNLNLNSRFDSVNVGMKYSEILRKVIDEFEK